MNYSYAIHQILENLNKDRHDTNDIKSVKHDMEQTIREMFSDAEAPIKSEAFTLTKLDTDSITTVPLELSTTSPAYTHTSVIKSMNELTIVANNESSTPPAVGTSNLNVTITLSTGEEVLNQDIPVVDAVVSTEVIDILVNDVVGATMVITGSAFSGGGADELYVTSVSWTKSFNSLQLPDYVYVPFDAHFKVSNLVDGAGYLNKEMAEEQYNRWVPYGGIDNQDGSVFLLDDGPNPTTYTLENLEYDGRIGYFFYVYEGKLYLMFKPAVEGVVNIRFSYIPTIDVTESTEIQFHQAFINGIIAGTTYRQLQKEMLKAETEIQIVKIKTLQGQYMNSYKSSVKTFSGYNRKKTGVASIKMFGIVDDFSMELY